MRRNLVPSCVYCIGPSSLVVVFRFFIGIAWLRNKVLAEQEPRSLNERTLDLSDIQCWIKTPSHVVH